MVAAKNIVINVDLVSGKAPKRAQRVTGKRVQSALAIIMKTAKVSPRAAVGIAQQNYWTRRDALPKKPTQEQLDKVETYRQLLHAITVEYRAQIKSKRRK